VSLKLVVKEKYFEGDAIVYENEHDVIKEFALEEIKR
jgi:dihydroxyacid dehydratase/phosphogluconate dehydratase